MNPRPPTLRPATWTPAIRMGLSIAVATGLYGISFGALAVAAGLTVWQAMTLSLLMFTGGSQFAFIGVIAGGGAGSAALGAAALLGVRNAVYGMQMNAMVAPTGWRKAVAAHQAPPGNQKPECYYFNSYKRLPIKRQKPFLGSSSEY